MLDFTVSPVLVEDGRGAGTAPDTGTGQSATFETQAPNYQNQNRLVRVQVDTYGHEGLVDLDRDKQYRVRIEEIVPE